MSSRSNTQKMAAPIDRDWSTNGVCSGVRDGISNGHHSSTGVQGVLLTPTAPAGPAAIANGGRTHRERATVPSATPNGNLVSHNACAIAGVSVSGSGSGIGSTSKGSGGATLKKVKPQVNTRAAVGFLKSSKRIREARMKEEQERRASVGAGGGAKGPLPGAPDSANKAERGPQNQTAPVSTSHTVFPPNENGTHIAPRPTPQAVSSASSTVSATGIPASTLPGAEADVAATSAPRVGGAAHTRGPAEKVDVFSLTMGSPAAARRVDATSDAGAAGSMSVPPYLEIVRESDSELAVAAKAAAAAAAAASTEPSSTKSLLSRFAAARSFSNSSHSPQQEHQPPQQQDFVRAAPPQAQGWSEMVNKLTSANACLAAGKAGGAAVEPWTEGTDPVEADDQPGGVIGRKQQAGGEVWTEAELWASNASEDLYGGRSNKRKYTVQEHATPTSEPKVVLLLQEIEGQLPLVGVEFTHMRLAVSFETADDARAELGSLLYLCPVSFRVLDAKPPFTRGLTRTFPAPFTLPLGPFGDAGLQRADLIMEVNGSRFGDERYRWWDSGDRRVPETNGTRNATGRDGKRVDAAAQGLGLGKEGNGTGKLARKPARKIFQLPWVELKILRATGETSRSTTSAGSTASERDWLTRRLLEQQRARVAATPEVVNLTGEFEVDRETMELRRQTLSRSLEGAARALAAETASREASRAQLLESSEGQESKAAEGDRPTSCAQRIKASMDALQKLLALDTDAKRLAEVQRARNGLLKPSNRVPPTRNTPNQSHLQAQSGVAPHCSSAPGVPAALAAVQPSNRRGMASSSTDLNATTAVTNGGAKTSTAPAYDGGVSAAGGDTLSRGGTSAGEADIARTAVSGGLKTSSPEARTAPDISTDSAGSTKPETESKTKSSNGAEASAPDVDASRDRTEPGRGAIAAAKAISRAPAETPAAIRGSTAEQYAEARPAIEPPAAPVRPSLMATLPRVNIATTALVKHVVEVAAREVRQGRRQLGGSGGAVGGAAADLIGIAATPGTAAGRAQAALKALPAAAAAAAAIEAGSRENFEKVQRGVASGDRDKKTGAASSSAVGKRENGAMPSVVPDASAEKESEMAQAGAPGAAASNVRNGSGSGKRTARGGGLARECGAPSPSAETKAALVGNGDQGRAIGDGDRSTAVGGGGSSSSICSKQKRSRDDAAVTMVGKSGDNRTAEMKGGRRDGEASGDRREADSVGDKIQEAVALTKDGPAEAKLGAAVPQEPALVPPLRRSEGSIGDGVVAAAAAGGGGGGKAVPGGNRGRRGTGLCRPGTVEEVLNCLKECTDAWGRTVLYFDDGGVEIPLQDDWDRREMETVRRERRRRAEEDALVEARMWGRSTSPLPGGAVDAKLDSATGEGAAGAGEGKNGAEDIETFFIPSEPLWSGEWQVPDALAPNQMVVRKLTNVNGIQTDGLTLDELRETMVEMGDALRAEESPEEPPAAVSYFTTHTVILREGVDAPSPPAGEEGVVVSAADVEAAVAAVVNAAEAVPTTPTRSPVEENAVASVQDGGGGGDGGGGYGGIAEGSYGEGAEANDAAKVKVSGANRETDLSVAAATVSSSAESLPKSAGVEADVGGDSTAEAARTGAEAAGAAEPPVLVPAQAPGKPRTSPMQQEASVAAAESASQQRPSNDERLTNSKKSKEEQEGTGAGRVPDDRDTAGGATRASNTESPPVAARATAGKRPRSPTTAEADERARPSSPPAPPVRTLTLGGETVAPDGGTATGAAALTTGGVDGVCPGLIVWAPRGNEMWPAVVLEAVPRPSATCWSVRYLGAVSVDRPQSSTDSAVGASAAGAVVGSTTQRSEAPSPACGETYAAEMLPFPGGRSISVVASRADVGSVDEKRGKNGEQLAEELYTDPKKYLQLAIDHAIYLCIKYDWRHEFGMVNILTGDSTAGEKDQRSRMRKGRIDRLELPAAAKHWIDKRANQDARRRFCTVFNNRTETANAMCLELRDGSAQLTQWIGPRRSLSVAQQESAHSNSGSSAAGKPTAPADNPAASHPAASGKTEGKASGQSKPPATAKAGEQGKSSKEKKDENVDDDDDNDNDNDNGEAPDADAGVSSVSHPKTPGVKRKRPGDAADTSQAETGKNGDSNDDGGKHAGSHSDGGLQDEGRGNGSASIFPGTSLTLDKLVARLEFRSRLFFERVIQAAIDQEVLKLNEPLGKETGNSKEVDQADGDRAGASKCAKRTSPPSNKQGSGAQQAVSKNGSARTTSLRNDSVAVEDSSSGDVTTRVKGGSSSSSSSSSSINQRADLKIFNDEIESPETSSSKDTKKSGGMKRPLSIVGDTETPTVHAKLRNSEKDTRLAAAASSSGADSVGPAADAKRARQIPVAVGGDVSGVYNSPELLLSKDNSPSSAPQPAAADDLRGAGRYSGMLEGHGPFTDSDGDGDGGAADEEGEAFNTRPKRSLLKTSDRAKKGLKKTPKTKLKLKLKVRGAGDIPKKRANPADGGGGMIPKKSSVQLQREACLSGQQMAPAAATLEDRSGGAMSRQVSGGRDNAVGLGTPELERTISSSVRFWGGRFVDRPPRPSLSPRPESLKGIHDNIAWHEQRQKSTKDRLSGGPYLGTELRNNLIHSLQASPVAQNRLQRHANCIYRDALRAGGSEDRSVSESGDVGQRDGLDGGERDQRGDSAGQGGLSLELDASITEGQSEGRHQSLSPSIRGQQGTPPRRHGESPRRLRGGAFGRRGGSPVRGRGRGRGRGQGGGRVHGGRRDGIHGPRLGSNPSRHDRPGGDYFPDRSHSSSSRSESRERRGSPAAPGRGIYRGGANDRGNSCEVEQLYSPRNVDHDDDEVMAGGSDKDLKEGRGKLKGGSHKDRKNRRTLRLVGDMPPAAAPSASPRLPDPSGVTVADFSAARRRSTARSQNRDEKECREKQQRLPIADTPPVPSPDFVAAGLSVDSVATPPSVASAVDEGKPRNRLSGAPDARPGGVAARHVSAASTFVDAFTRSASTVSLATQHGSGRPDGSEISADTSDTRSTPAAAPPEDGGRLGAVVTAAELTAVQQATQEQVTTPNDAEVLRDDPPPPPPPFPPLPPTPERSLSPFTSRSPCDGRSGGSGDAGSDMAVDDMELDYGDDKPPLPPGTPPPLPEFCSADSDGASFAVAGRREAGEGAGAGGGGGIEGTTAQPNVDTVFFGNQPPPPQPMPAQPAVPARRPSQSYFVSQAYASPQGHAAGAVVTSAASAPSDPVLVRAVPRPVAPGPAPAPPFAASGGTWVVAAPAPASATILFLPAGTLPPGPISYPHPVLPPAPAPAPPPTPPATPPAGVDGTGGGGGAGAESAAGRPPTTPLPPAPAPQRQAPSVTPTHVQMIARARAELATRRAAQMPFIPPVYVPGGNDCKPAYIPGGGAQLSRSSSNDGRFSRT